MSPSRFFKLRPFCRPGTDPGRTWPGAALRGALCCGSEPAQSDPALLTARAARIILFCGRADRPYPSDRLTGRNLKPVPHPDGPAGNGRHHEGSPRSPSPAGPLCSRANRWRAAASRRRRPGPSDAAPSTIGSPGPPGRPLRARGRMSKTLGRPARPGHRGVGRRWQDGLDHAAVTAAGAGGRGRRPGRVAAADERPGPLRAHLGAGFRVFKRRAPRLVTAWHVGGSSRSAQQPTPQQHAVGGAAGRWLLGARQL